MDFDWKMAFKDKRFFTVFNNSTSILFRYTTLLVLKLLIIARTFNKYKNNSDFTEILYSMELIFKKVLRRFIYVISFSMCNGL